MSGNWYGLKGTVKRASGTAGTVTFVTGTRILQLHAFPSATLTGTVQIGSDPSAVTLPAASGWWGIQELHTDLILSGTGAAVQIVFSNTQSYFIEYVGPAGLS